MPTLLIVIAVMAWLVMATRTLWAADLIPNMGRQWLKKPKNEAQALRVFTWIAALIFASATWINDAESDIGSFRKEATSIAIAVVFIEEITRRRAQLEYKQAIINQMGSLSNDFALDAVRIATNEGWLINGSLQGIILSKANLRGADLSGANLQGADLSYANLQDADLSEANLQRANLSIVSLQGANLSRANLQGAGLLKTNLQGANLFCAKFRDAFLFLANLRGATLFEADLRGATLFKADLQGADLNHANLQGASLFQADLQDADLRQANLQGAGLVEANLQGANLSIANLQDAKYNNRTTWPDGFDPIAAGAILIDPAHPTEDKAQ